MDRSKQSINESVNLISEEDHRPVRKCNLSSDDNDDDVDVGTVPVVDVVDVAAIPCPCPCPCPCPLLDHKRNGDEDAWTCSCVKMSWSVSLSEVVGKRPLLLLPLPLLL